MKHSLSAGWIFLGLVLSLDAQAAGNKKTPDDSGAGGSPSCGGTLPYALPDPLRAVFVPDVKGVQVFNTPNQVATSLHADLREMAKALLSPPLTRFAPIDDSSQIAPREGDVFTQLNVAVTNFTLESVELGVSFGYNNNIPIPVVSGIQVGAEGRVRIGSVRMAFSLARCTRRGAGATCETPVSVEATQKVLGSDVEFGISYGLIKLGGDLMTRTDLGEKLRKIMIDGFTKLASHSGVKLLPWSALLTHVASQTNSFWMNAGVESFLMPFQSFVIYESSLTAGMPEVFRPLACAHTSTDVFDGSSRIVVDRAIEAGALERIRPGNVVRVGTAGCAGN